HDHASTVQLRLEVHARVAGLRRAHQLVTDDVVLEEDGGMWRVHSIVEVDGGIAVNDEARGGPDFAVFGVGGADERFRAAVQAVHDEGSTILAQLFHAGRYALASGMVDRHGEPQRVLAP
ncbi:hypothetical protein IAE22_32560, partial [Bacillus sp. S34]|nr:hypothetical protein [Bacillus sp. S34]